ncbi:dihydroorotase [Aestuariispira ectoiniformans]|uniref:dihydroorotase n=1 Tax=Aestuariispira ectoiniformans TaxID=2775080 RepID=UPI00223B7BBD|nr:dihydroorotase [Aestuariispira ectoiniformans]
MTDTRIAYLNARLLDPASGMDTKGALLIENGRIADFGPHLFKGGAPSVSQVVDCKGMCLAPGLIDMRVQLREPGEEHKETFDSASEAASAGGITTMVCLPNTNPIIDDESGVQYVARRARDLKRTKIYCYGAITQNMEGSELTEMGLLSEAGALAFTDGQKAVASSKVMKRALSYSKAFDLLMVQHPEDPGLSDGGAMNQGELASRLGLSGIPPQAEVMMIERDLRLVEMTGARYHVAHVSTRLAVEAIRKAKAQGLPVTCDTAPHYFALNETSVGEYRTFAKVSPPLRDETDRRAIVEGLADGTIDAIASDHAPHDEDSKRLPFAQAAAGVIGLETLLPITLELYHNGHMSLLDALKKVTQGPADLLRLPSGRLKRGAPADLFIFDTDKPRTLREENFRSKSKNSPFDGRPVQGEVLATIVDGRLLFRGEGF